jgi:hypothetical protein
MCEKDYFCGNSCPAMEFDAHFLFFFFTLPFFFDAGFLVGVWQD